MKVYVIARNGLFSYGYVRITLFKKTQLIEFESLHDAFKWATKFRYRFTANAICKMYNFLSARNYELCTYSVKEFYLS